MISLVAIRYRSRKSQVSQPQKISPEMVSTSTSIGASTLQYSEFMYSTIRTSKSTPHASSKTGTFPKPLTGIFRPNS